MRSSWWLEFQDRCEIGGRCRDDSRCGRSEGGVDLLKSPGSAESVADNGVEGSGKRCAGEGLAKGESGEEELGEIVDVGSAVGVGLFGSFGIGGGFADAVAAELDGVASGEDVGGFDVAMGEAGGVEGLQGGDEADGDLAGFLGGEAAALEDLAEVIVGGLHDGVDDGGAIEIGFAELPEGNEMGIGDFGDATPAIEDLCGIVVGLDDADDGGSAGTVVRGEEGATAFGGD